MMILRLIISCILLQVFSLLGLAQTASGILSHVNPLIGTGGHGHTFPGPTLPFGMVQLSPDTRQDNSWDGCSGYHYTDSIIYGFSHTHLSGTGVSDWADVLMMPTIDATEFTSNTYANTMLHKTEVAKAGYYSILLPKHAILAELTCTKRVGIHQYTYPTTQNKHIIIDLVHRDEVLDSEFEITYPNMLRGYRRSKAWAKDQTVYFEIQFSENFTDIVFLDNDTINKHPYARGKKLKALVSFASSSKNIVSKVAISGVDNDGAYKNLLAEATHNNFSKYRTDAEQSWLKQLSQFTVYGGTPKDRTNFYTALYHCFIHPSLYNDVDGRYRGMDNKIHQLAKGQNYYNVFSLWDTYRGLHPLLTLTDTTLVADLVRTIYLQARAAKRLPVWELSNNETFCMIGYHSASVLYDAWQKGIRPVPADSLLEVMMYSAKENKAEINSLDRYGYVRAMDASESVSKTLEYAYNDWCITQIALACKQACDTANVERMAQLNDIILEMHKRSYAWKNILDPETKFMRPIYNGTWLHNFSPYVVDNNFTEANSWQYSFYVPQHFSDLMRYHGGADSMYAHLNNLFNAAQQTQGREQADITGLIGQYAHGNEPSHHIAWLYHKLGRTQDVQKYVSKILNDMYTPQPDGLIGNEDCGQMSAWYVLASMGFYPICPGDGKYAACAPLWDSVRISSKACNLTIIKGDTKLRRAADVLHSSLVSNAVITIPQPVNNTVIDILPHPIVANPVIRNATQFFEGEQKITIECLDTAAHIFYTIDNQQERLYTEPITINKSCTLNFFSALGEQRSPTQDARFIILPKDVSVKIKSKYNRQYTAGGDKGLVDGLNGSTLWQTGFWQGYQNQDFEADVIFDAPKNLDSVGASFLSDQRSWIFYPTELKVMVSTDGTNFMQAVSIPIAVPRNDDTNTITHLMTALPVAMRKGIKAIRYHATNYGKLPSWHPGAGNNAFIFIDEVYFK